MSRLPASIVSAALLLCALPVSGRFLRVYYPDIEQGSATLVVSPTDQALLIDAGTGIKATEDGIEDFINDLIDIGVVASVDFIIATHYDEDHIGRMDNVLQLVPLPPTVIVYNRGKFGGTSTTFAYSDYAFSASFQEHCFGLGGNESSETALGSREITMMHRISEPTRFDCCFGPLRRIGLPGSHGFRAVQARSPCPEGTGSVSQVASRYLEGTFYEAATGW